MKNSVKIKTEGKKSKKSSMMASNTPARHIMLSFYIIVTQAFYILLQEIAICYVGFSCLQVTETAES